MALEQIVSFDDYSPDKGLSSMEPALKQSGLTSVVSFDDFTTPAPQQSLPGSEQGEAISAPSTEVSQSPLPQGTWGDVFSRPFTGAGDRMRGALEGMKAFGAMVGERELSLQDPMSSDAGRVIKLSDELRKNPGDADLRSSIEVMGVNPDDLISTDINTAFGARNVLSGKLRNVRLANDDYVKSSLQRGKEAQQRVEKTRVDYGDTAKGTSQQFIEDILTGSVDMIPAIVASAITGPATGAAIMGGQVLGHSTLEGMNELGLTPDGAGLRSMAFAGAEFVPEIWALKIFKDAGGSRLTKILKAAGAEGLQEGITQTIQTGIDLGIDVKEDMTLGEFINEVGYSMAVGAGVGGTLRTPGALLERKEQSPLDTPPATPASATPPPAAPVAPDLDKEVTFDDLMAEAPVDTAPQPAADTLRTVQPGESIEVVPQPLPGEAPAADTTLRTVEPGESLPVEPQPLPAQAETLPEQAPTESIVPAQDANAVEATAETAPVAAPEAVQTNEAVQPTEPVQAPEAVSPETDAQPASPEQDSASLNENVEQITAAANEAATSPLNDLPEPTDAQKEVGNYKKGKVKFQGLDISIENPAGSKRSGTDGEGNNWEVEVPHHYGYIKRTEGADGEQVDAFIGQSPGSQKVFVVDQINPDGTFDEHKVMLAFDTQADAEAGYLASYSKGWKIGPVTEMDIAEFKAWVSAGKNADPLSTTAFASAAPQASQPVAEAGTDVTAPADQITEYAEKARSIKNLRSYVVGRYGKEKAKEMEPMVQAAWNARKEKVPVTPAESKPGRPLSEIEVTETFEAEDTGKEVTVTMAADKALADIDSRIDSIKALVACLKAAA